MIDLLLLFHPTAPVTPGVHPSAIVAAEARVDATAAVGPLAVVERGARIDAGVRVGAQCYIGTGVEIGEGSTLGPRVTLLTGVRLGRRVLVHAGAVLGADGFGFAFDGARHRKIPQVGGVVIEDDVEIGANTTIDRATLGDTIIRRGTKIDNLVQIGHNAEVGEHSILIAQVGVSGSSRLGRGVVLAGQVGVADHVTIGDGAMVAAQGGVPSSLEAGGRYLGTPARPILEAKRILAAESRLPQLLQRVRALERAVEKLGGGALGPGTRRDE
jgi:UDP-3-O-[3-hydroxymyristoyl] glucosamine N-acyltransferase